MEERNMINEYLTTITAILSLFGTLFLILSFFIWKDIQTTSRRILVYISTADFFTSVATIVAIASFWIRGSESRQVCFVQSIVGTLSVLCSFFWTVFIALYLYISVCHKNPRLAKRLMPLFHVCGWGIPIIVVSVAVFGNKLGNNDDKVTSGWCWVNENLGWNDQVLWMLLAGKLWEIVAYFTIAVLYALIKRRMTKEIHERDGLLRRSTVAQAQKAERKLICIPLIFVLLRMWGTIRFILLVLSGPDYKSADWLLILQGIGDNAPGFANFLLFCFFTEKCFGNFHWWIKRCKTCLTRKAYCSSLSTVYSDDGTLHEPHAQHSDISSEINSGLMTTNSSAKSYLSIQNV